MTRRFVALNEEGERIGETHPRSCHSDETVDLVRELHEDRGWSYTRISRKLKMSVAYIGKLCRYERRNQTPDRYKWL